MEKISSYFFILVLSITLLLEILKAIKLLFNPNILKHKVFDFPKRKTAILLYHLCVILVLLTAIFWQLEIDITEL